ncbi:hypothetical protein ALC53_14259 [Atta colombica]|uniref:Uncharacterized protein n=1 Tax=Atta colombica TaxID=520822 RepID=A0A195AT29_9HYME|nr:hypothetical protein ALC53_14259 [Atta colombica]
MARNKGMDERAGWQESLQIVGHSLQKRMPEFSLAFRHSGWIFCSSFFCSPVYLRSPRSFVRIMKAEICLMFNMYQMDKYVFTAYLAPLVMHLPGMVILTVKEINLNFWCPMYVYL